MLFTNLIQGNLSTSYIGREIEYFSFTNSTNEDVWEYVEENVSPGFVVITDNQKQGKGRRGNTWLSEPGKSLTFSLFLKPSIKFEQIGLLPLIAGSSLTEAINSFTTLKADLKWPNDILINGKKVGGILCEHKVVKDESHIVLGIGLNVNESELNIDISHMATSLSLEAGHPIQREPLLASILNQLEKNIEAPPSTWVSKWESHCTHLNQSINFHSSNEVISGIFVGLSEIGQAVIKINDETKVFSSGVIELS